MMSACLLLAAEASNFWRPKSHQKRCQQKGSFALMAFTVQIGQNHGLRLIRPAALALGQRFSEPANALSGALGHQFCRISPGALLLTDAERLFTYIIF